MLPIEIASKIYDVSVADWTVRDFHGYKTERGVTYNSYLIMDEKICLIDTVKAMFAEELLAKISQVVAPEKIDYIVINHVEPDHSGSLKRIAQVAPNAKIVLNMQGKNEVVRHYGEQYDFHVIKDGDKLSLGRRELTFVGLPMLHWPDSMATYCADDGILFSNDAFGQHYATAKRFDDQVDKAVIMYEAKKYFANILWPYAKLIDKAVAKVAALDVKMIATAHGAIWRSYISEIIELYKSWGEGVTSNKVIIAYDTMWGATEEMARAVLQGVIDAGNDARLMRMNDTPNSTLVAELFDAGGLIIGSPTLNNGMLPTLGSTLTYLKGLQPKGKKATYFGTFGWAGGARKDIEEFLLAAGFDLQDGFTCKWKASSEDLAKVQQLGYDFAKNLK